MIMDEAYLYKYMPEAECYLLALIPPEEELYHKFSRRFERKMRELIKYERRTPWERKFFRGMKIAFATIAIILVLALGSAMTVKASRSILIQFLIEVFEELTSFSGNDVSVVDDVLEPIEPKYVPEQYEKVDQTVTSTKCMLAYTDTEGNIIRYRQELLSNPILYMDSEDTTYSVITIKGNEVVVHQEKDVIALYWTDQTYSYYLRGSVAMDELEKMVKSMMKV